MTDPNMRITIAINDIDHRGFSLIEVLVALVVLSIGLLGVAALQVEGLQTSRSALLRTRAVMLTGDMVDRIRANPRGAANYVAGWGAAAPPGALCSDTAIGPAAVDCTPQQMAAFDMFIWKNALNPNGPNGLPGGGGSLVVDTTVNPPVHTILVRWQDEGLTRTYSVVFEHDTTS